MKRILSVLALASLGLGVWAGTHAVASQAEMPAEPCPTLFINASEFIKATLASEAFNRLEDNNEFKSFDRISIDADRKVCWSRIVTISEVHGAEEPQVKSAYFRVTWNISERIWDVTPLNNLEE